MTSPSEPEPLTVPGLPHRTIAAARWWTAASPAGALLGAVLIHDTHTDTVKAYLGQGHGWDQDYGARLIAQWGAKLQPDVGRAMFPSAATEQWAVDD